jgi:hypothetical protein
MDRFLLWGNKKHVFLKTESNENYYVPKRDKVIHEIQDTYCLMSKFVSYRQLMLLE